LGSAKSANRVEYCSAASIVRDDFRAGGLIVVISRRRLSTLRKTAKRAMDLICCRSEAMFAKKRSRPRDRG